MLKIDPEFKSLIPPLSNEEYEQLEKNCISEGIRESVLVWDGIIIDGHNRYEIAQKHDLKYDITFKHFDSREEVIDWMINNQLGRRNLTKETQSYLRGLQYKREKKKITNPYGVKGKDEPQNDEHLSTAQKLAEQHKVSKATIERDEKFAEAVDTIVENTAPEVKQKILNKEIEITKKETEQIAKENPKKQKEIITTAIEKNIPVKKAIQEIKQEERKETLQTKAKELPAEKFQVIYCDPPWAYNNSGFEMSAEQKYPTMQLDEIKKINVKTITAENAVIFMWATNPLLKEAFELMESWGFEYKTNFVWTKDRHTAGFYIYGQHELLLIGVKGSMLPIGEKPKSIITGSNNVHSKKPDGVYEIIESMYPELKYVELFARNTPRANWTKWGNEVGKYE